MELRAGGAAGRRRSGVEPVQRGAAADPGADRPGQDRSQRAEAEGRRSGQGCRAAAAVSWSAPPPRCRTPNPRPPSWSSELAELSAREQTSAADLDLKRAQLSETLMALERLSLRPPQAAFFSDRTPVDEARAATLMAAATQALDQRARQLQSDLAEVQELREVAAARQEELAASVDRLAQENQELAPPAEARKPSCRKRPWRRARSEEAPGPAGRSGAKPQGTARAAGGGARRGRGAATGRRGRGRQEGSRSSQERGRAQPPPESRRSGQEDRKGTRGSGRRCRRAGGRDPAPSRPRPCGCSPRRPTCRPFPSSPAG